MSSRHFDDWLKAFVNYASFGEAPLTMYYWVGVSALAGALRRHVYIEQGYFQWFPNFYIILVAPPGVVAKSTTASIGMNLLRKVPGVLFGPDVVTWQALAQSLAGSCELVQMPDGTLHPMSAITIESSEFGTFLNPNDREMVDMLVSLWDGKRGAFKKVTKTQGNDEIQNPFVNIIACTTPSWISGTFPEYMIGGGFTSRCIFVFADAKRQYVAYPSLVLPPGFQEMQEQLIQDLEHISTIRGQFHLPPATIEWGETWYEQHYKNRPPHLDNQRFGGYIARKQTHVHKLAMVIALSRKDDLLLLPEELDLANQMVSSLETAMPKVFDQIGRTESSKHLAELITTVNAHRQGIGYNELMAQLTRIYSDHKTFDGAVQMALRAGYITSKVEEGKPLYFPGVRPLA